MDKTEQNKNFQQGLKLRAENYAKKRREQEKHRQGLGNWMGMTTAAMKAMQDMDRADKKLAAMGAMLLLSVLLASGQGYYVIADTNQLKDIPANVKLELRRDLYHGETVTFVVTNWSSVDDPKKLTLPNGTLAVMYKQEARFLTNVEHRITFGGETRTWKVMQTFSQPIDTRELIEAAPIQALAVPTRQQR